LKFPMPHGAKILALSAHIRLIETNLTAGTNIQATNTPEVNVSYFVDKKLVYHFDSSILVNVGWVSAGTAVVPRSTFKKTYVQWHGEFQTPKEPGLVMFYSTPDPVQAIIPAGDEIVVSVILDAPRRFRG